MGIADLVPGVSGGTIALISGIYEELIESIASINLRSIKILKKEGFYKFWCAINGSFILAVFSIPPSFFPHFLPFFIHSFFFRLPHLLVLLELLLAL